MVSSFSRKPAVRYLHTDVKPYKLVSVFQFPNRGAVATPNSCCLFPGRDAAAWHFQVPSHEEKGRPADSHVQILKCADAPLTSLHAPSGRPTQAEGVGGRGGGRTHATNAGRPAALHRANVDARCCAIATQDLYFEILRSPSCIP